MKPAALKQEDIMPVLSRFYASVRQDPQLGPVFNTIVEDWTEHLQRLEDFWSSLMLTSGRYKGNPVAMHVIHAQRIQPHMFARWLELWEETTNEMVHADVARDMQAKAARIAERLNSAMHGPASAVAPCDLSSAAPAKPYRQTAIFDHETVPPALLTRHETRAGTWAIVRVIEGRIALHLHDTTTVSLDLDPLHPGVIAPRQPHHLALGGPVRFRLEFFDRDPQENHRNQQGAFHA